MKNYKIILITVLLLLSFQLVSADLNSSIVNYWAFDGNAQDNVSSLDGSVTGATLTTGIINQAYNYDESGDYIQLPSSSLLTIDNDKTFSVWVKKGSLDTTDYIMDIGGDKVSTRRKFFSIGITTSNNIFAEYEGNNLASRSNAYTVETITDTNTFHHIVVTFNYTAHSFKIYLDGTETSYSTISSSGAGVVNGVSSYNIIGAIYQESVAITNLFNGVIDELAIWDRILNETEISNLYASGSPTSEQQYPFTPIGEDYNYNLTVYQIPNDITITNFTDVQINLSVETDNDYNNLNNSYAYVTTTLNTQLNNGCAIIENEECTRDETPLITNMTKINNTYFSYDVDLYNVYPAYYTFDNQWLQSVPKEGNYSLYNNNYIKFKVYNFTTLDNAYLSIDYDASPLDDSYPLVVYYCNSSYEGGILLNNPNCEVISTYLYNSADIHYHGLYSKHINIPFTVSTIEQTELSYFVIVTNAPNIFSSWKFPYVTNTSYDGDNFEIGSPNNWLSTNNLFDIHIHQFLTSDYISYNVTYVSGDVNNEITTSDNYIDYYDVDNTPPFQVQIYNPCNIEYTIGENLTIFFNWSQPLDFENDTLTQDIKIISNLKTYNIANNLTDNITSYNYNYEELLLSGTYYTSIEISDDFNTRTSLSTCSFTLCKNDWVRVPSSCENDVRLINYKDNNECSESYYPSDYGEYEYCTTLEDERKDFWLYFIGCIIIFLIASIIGYTMKNIYISLLGSATLIIFGVLFIQQYSLISIFTALLGVVSTFLTFNFNK